MNYEKSSKLIKKFVKSDVFVIIKHKQTQWKKKKKKLILMSVIRKTY